MHRFNRALTDYLAPRADGKPPVRGVSAVVHFRPHTAESLAAYRERLRTRQEPVERRQPAYAIRRSASPQPNQSPSTNGGPSNDTPTARVAASGEGESREHRKTFRSRLTPRRGSVRMKPASRPASRRVGPPLSANPSRRRAERLRRDFSNLGEVSPSDRSMTARQRTLYWREWQAVLRVYPEADRHELHVQSLGKDKSSSDFSNADLDKVLATFRAITRPSDLDGQLRQVHQPETRALYALDQAMRCLALYVADAAAYRDTILHSFWPGRSLGDLRADQVHTLRMTIWARVNGADGMRSQAGHSLHEMRTLAHIPCECRICRPVQKRVSGALVRQTIHAQP